MLSIAINVLLVIHVLVSLLIILLVLMQRPKNEGLGAAFGGGMTENLFGAQTTNVLQTTTRYLGGIFFALTLLLSWLYVKRPTKGATCKSACWRRPWCRNSRRRPRRPRRPRRTTKPCRKPSRKSCKRKPRRKPTRLRPHPLRKSRRQPLPRGGEPGGETSSRDAGPGSAETGRGGQAGNSGCGKARCPGEHADSCDPPAPATPQPAEKPAN